MVYSANGLALEFTLGTDFGKGNTAAISTIFTVKVSGGATFQLGTTASTRQTIGIDTLSTYNLGGGNGTVRLTELKYGGSADLDTNAGNALSSVRDARKGGALTSECSSGSKAHAFGPLLSLGKKPRSRSSAFLRVSPFAHH